MILISILSTVSKLVKKLVLADVSIPFFRLLSLILQKIIPIEKAVEYMKDAATKSYGKKKVRKLLQ